MLPRLTGSRRSRDFLPPRADHGPAAVQNRESRENMGNDISVCLLVQQPLWKLLRVRISSRSIPWFRRPGRCLLSRYSGETDVVLGVIVSGRPAAITGVESMLGLFINALPLRISVPGDATLVDWLQNLQNRQLKDREYEYSSLAEVQRLSEVPAGQPLRKPAGFSDYPRREPTKGNKAASATRSVERTSYPLTAIAAPGEELLLRLLYNRASFDDAGSCACSITGGRCWKQ